MKPGVRGSNFSIAVGIVAILTLTMGGLWVVARDAPSSAVGNFNNITRIEVSPSEGCENFANYWLEETSVPVEAETLEGFTNCRLGTDGKWYTWPELPAELDPDPPTIPEDREAEAADLRVRIVADLSALQGSFSNAMMDELGKIYNEQHNPVIGQIREGASISSIRTRYARIMNGFMLDPEREALADYVGWSMQQRMDSYGVFRRACLQDETEFLRQPCTGMEDNLSIRYAPWYWELANEHLLDAYLHHLYGDEEDVES